MRKPAVAVAAVSLTLMIALSATAGTAPVKVLAGAAEQFRPSSNGTHLAWTHFKRSTGVDVYVKPLGAAGERRVNEAGTAAWLGSFVQGTDEIVYQQRRRSRSDIFGYDVSDRIRTKLPAPISGPEWEWMPVASSDVVLFLRDILTDRGRYKKTQLLLADRSGGPVLKLIGDVGGASVFPGFAGSQYVAWTRCARTCNVYVHDLATSDTTKLPLPADRAQYAPVIDEAAGTIHFVRSGPRCGQAVTFRSAPLDDAASSVALARLPRGIDTDWIMSLAFNPVTNVHDIYFGRFDCARQDTDVYVIEGVDAITPRIRAADEPIRDGDGAGTGHRRSGPEGASPGHP